jgi:outer membrane protein
LFGIASYKRLQGDVAVSPIVRDTGSPNQVFASIGLGYTF